MITMRDIAREAGISQTTVSLVLNGIEGSVGISEKTRSKVLATAERLGYRSNELARAARTGRSNFLAFLVTGLAAEYESRTLAGMVEEAERHGFLVKLIFPSTRESVSDIARRIVEQRPAGVLFRSLTGEWFSVAVREFHGAGIPFAVAGTSEPQAVGIRICPDNAGGAAAAANHLLDLGHREIAFASGALSLAYAAQRYASFLESLRRRGVEFRGRNAVLTSYTDKFEAELLSLFSSDERPSAIFCAGDHLAMLAARAARKAKLRVPEDLSIVGYGRLSMAIYSDPPLTTVAEPFEELGGTACAALLKEIGAQKKQSFSKELSRQLPVRLVIGESTAKVKGG